MKIDFKEAARRTEIAIALAFALGLSMAVPAFAQSVLAVPTSESGFSMCSGGTCVWGPLGNPYVRQVPQPESADEIHAMRVQDEAWKERCKPTTRFDKLGVEHYVYAAEGCEFGRTR